MLADAMSATKQESASGAGRSQDEGLLSNTAADRQRMVRERLERLAERIETLLRHLSFDTRPQVDRPEGYGRMVRHVQAGQRLAALSGDVLAAATELRECPAAPDPVDRSLIEEALSLVDWIRPASVNGVPVPTARRDRFSHEPEILSRAATLLREVERRLPAEPSGSGSPAASRSKRSKQEVSEAIKVALAILADGANQKGSDGWLTLSASQLAEAASLHLSTVKGSEAWKEIIKYREKFTGGKRPRRAGRALPRRTAGLHRNVVGVAEDDQRVLPRARR